MKYGMKGIEIDTANGLAEIADFDDGVMFENQSSLDNDALESLLDNFKNDFVMQWMITDEQYEFLDKKYGITKL